MWCWYEQDKVCLQYSFGKAQVPSPFLVLDKCSQGCSKNLLGIYFLSTEDFDQRDHSVSIFQTPPQRSEWICSKKWVPRGSSSGWAVSDRGWQQAGRHCATLAGVRTTEQAGKRSARAVPACPLMLWPLAWQTVLKLQPLQFCEFTQKAAIPALLPAFKSCLCRNAGSAFAGSKAGKQPCYSP